MEGSKRGAVAGATWPQACHLALRAPVGAAVAPSAVPGSGSRWVVKLLSFPGRQVATTLGECYARSPDTSELRADDRVDRGAVDVLNEADLVDDQHVDAIEAGW